MSEALTPHPDETQEQFTVRAHQQLLPTVSDPDERNRMVWSAWDAIRGPSSAEQRAAKRFSDPEKFVKQPNVCYFVEHETVDKDGNAVRFGVEDLVEITQTCNRRASDQEAFAAICDNHTSPTDNSHQGDPPVLGAVGSYRIGMTGHDEPKFSIFADEYHYADKAAELAKKPRRSIELLTFHHSGERYIDPVAALGGRAPRLALPSQYSASVASYSIGGHEVTRYQAEGPGMFPGGSNTHIKSTDYFGGEPEESMNISDEDIARIISAVGNMPENAWVREQMEAENGGAVSQDAPGGMDDVGGGFDDMDDMGMDDDMMQNAAMGEASRRPVVNGPGSDADYDDQQQFMADEAPDSDLSYEDSTMAYSANGDRYVPSEGQSAQQYQAMQRELQAIKSSHVNALQELRSMSREVEQAKRDKIDAERKSQIEALCSKYSTFDADEECDRLLFSAGADVSNQQFAAEIERLERIGHRSYQQSVERSVVPRGQVTNYRGGSEPKVERNAAFYAEVTRIQNEAANEGKHLHFNELQKLAEENLTS